MHDPQWYLTIRRFSGNGAPEEIAQRIREGLLPTLRQEPSFRAYYVSRIDGGGGTFSATLFDDQATARRINDYVLGWIGTNLADLLTGTPLITRATVNVHLDAERKGGESFMLVRATEGLGPTAGTLQAVQDKVIPLTLEQPGFRHLYTGRDEAQADRAIAVSVFTTRGTATAAHAQVAAMMAQNRDIWPHSPQVLMAGEVIVAALA